MAAETPDRIDIGRLQNLLGKGSGSLPVTPQSAERLVPRTPVRLSPSPHTPATYLHTNTLSHDRTGNLRLAYSNSVSYSQVDLGETQVDDVSGDYEFTQLDGDTTIISEHPYEEIVRSTPEPVVRKDALLEDTQPLDTTPEDEPESAPAYFPEAQRFTSPHIASSPIKKPAGHNPLSRMNLPGVVRRMPISLTQMFDAVSSPLRPGVSTGGTSLPPTPSAVEATKLLARTLSRMESDLVPGLSSPVAEPKAVMTEEEAEEDEEDVGQGSPTQVDPVTVYVSIQQSQEAREKNLRKKFGPRRKPVTCSVSPVAFNRSFVQKSQRQKLQDSSAGSDDGMISSGEERRRRVNAARRKGDDEVKRLFTAAKAPRDRGGLGKSQNTNGRGKERAKSEEMVKKRAPERPIGKLKRRQTKSASPPSAEETGDEEEVVVKRTPEISRANSAPTASSGSIPPAADDEDDVVLPMNKAHTSPFQPRPPALFTSDAPPSPSCEKTQVIDSNGPSSAAQTQYTQLLPQDWESLHNPTAAAVRRTRPNPVPIDKTPFPVSTIADSQPMPTLARQKTSLRSLPPFNIPSPGATCPVPEFVQETSGLVSLPETTSSFTPLQSDASSPAPARNLRTPFAAHGAAVAKMWDGATTIPETSPWERGGMVVPVGAEEAASESPTRKRKRYSGKVQKQLGKEKEQEVVPCSVEEVEKVLVGFAAMNDDVGFLSSRPEPDDVDMMGIVADVGAGRDAPVIEEVVPTAKQGRRAGRVSAKKIRMTPKAADVDELQQQQSEPVAASPPATNELAVAEPVPKAPKQAKPAPAKTKGKQPSILKPSRPSIGKAKPKALVRKTRSSTSLRNSIDSLTNIPIPLGASTDGDADILTSNNPAFSLSVLAPPDPPADTSITVPERVFALFRDGKHSFHPATVLESDIYTGTIKAVFDDGTEDIIERSHVRCLDLRIGDGVKVDLAGMKKAVWEIVGLKRGEADAKLSDCRGHIVVSVKARKSAGAADGEAVDVLVTNVYLVKSMWKDFNSRVYKDPPGAQRGIRNATPPESFSVRSAPTTPSKSFRPTPTAASFSTSFARPGAGLFAGMVFALSFGDKESVKKAITHKILQHGGKIVSSGFSELFYDIDRTDSSTDSSETTSPFTPRPETERVGFTAVIADTHSRRAKFLQALALGLPCLAAKWIDDCCRKARVVEWEHYLLPAGESKYLGTVRSRMLDSYDARSARLPGVIAGRCRLLEGLAVVVVVGGKGRVCEKRKPYLFLTYALGAVRVAKAVTLDAVDRILERGHWDLVYVEAKDREKAERLWRGKGLVRVVDDEWVIQSLILGRLIDDD